MSESAAKFNRNRTSRWLRKRGSKWWRRGYRRLARTLTTEFPNMSKLVHAARYKYAEHKIVGLTDRIRPIRPDFIIIGSPKCGTTWLLAALGQHPSVVVVPYEIEYFSSHPYYPAEWYYEHFARRLASTERIRDKKTCVLGEKSAHYCSLPQDWIRRMRHLLPDVRLILMARDPVSRHWAHAKKFFSKLQLRNPETAVLDVPRSILLDFFERERPVGEFSKIIANWKAHFPPERLLVVSQDRTLASPKTTYDAVLEHIGASTDYDPSLITLLSRVRNRGPRVEMPEDVADHLAVMYSDEQQWLREFFGDRQFAYAV